ncbi:RNA-binding protein, partial [Candidatus Micrarchaeota archaeon]|nr:RNA-binding protein [Candidatus Micrarchaeota archaeon]MBU1930338.1 RNA-binding protein [Candidatus Micrarchaeota archaeon]
GKNSSMLEVLKSGTASNLMIGRNGLAWIKGGDTALLRKAIRKIEEESHLDHLTEGITLFLKENAQKNEN